MAEPAPPSDLPRGVQLDAIMAVARQLHRAPSELAFVHVLGAHRINWPALHADLVELVSGGLHRSSVLFSDLEADVIALNSAGPWLTHAELTAYAKLLEVLARYYAWPDPT